MPPPSRLRSLNGRSYSRAAVVEALESLVVRGRRHAWAASFRAARASEYQGAPMPRPARVRGVAGPLLLVERRHGGGGDGRVVVPIEDVDRVLAAVYADPRLQGGRDRLYARVARRYVGISRRRTMRFLKRQEVWQLHQPILKQGPINQAIVAKAPLMHWQMDLVDFQKHSAMNNGHRYILTVVDAFSKYAWARALRNKRAATVAAALAGILDEARPVVMQSDNGPEFKDEVQRLLRRRGVKQIFSAAYKPQSNGGVERFNRTLKRMLFRHMTQYRSKRWNDVLPLFVVNYNSARHGTTKFAPSEMMRTRSRLVLRQARANIAAKARKLLKKTRRAFSPIRVGDTVRISANTVKNERRKGTFAKQFLARWSRPLFVVVRRSKGGAHSRPQYVVAAKETGERLLQRLYREDLQRVPRPEALMRRHEAVERPDYSEGRLFDREAHMRQLHAERRRRRQQQQQSDDQAAAMVASGRPRRRRVVPRQAFPMLRW